MSHFHKLLSRLRRDRRGMTTVEYVIALCLVGAVGVSLWSQFGQTVKGRLEGADTLIGSETQNALEDGGGEVPGSEKTEGDDGT